MKLSVYFQTSDRPRGGTGTIQDRDSRLQRVNEGLAIINNPEKVKLMDEVARGKLMKELGQDQLMLAGKNGPKKAAEILTKREKFEDLREIDLLTLRKEGIPLYEYLLTHKSGKLAPVKNNDLRVGEEFQVNFGRNKFMHDSVGAGDILPQDVTEISINGKIGQRDTIGGRPGYYAKEGKKWIYRPIYDGDTIKILSRSPLSEKEREENEKTDAAYFQRRTAEDILRSSRNGKDPRSELSYLSDEEFNAGNTFAKQIEDEGKEETSSLPRPSSESTFLLYYGRYLDDICKKLSIPQEVMLAIFRKETTGFQAQATNKDTQAHGIGQILPETWQEIQDKHLGRYGIHGKILDRNNIKDQILAATIYLRFTSDERGSIEGGIMRYFGISSENLEIAKKQNPPVLAVMRENKLDDTPRGFEQAYLIWLGLKPGHVISTYNPTWKNKLEITDVADGAGLPYGQNQRVLPDGTTWCGMTARQNAEKFGAIFPPIYNSSQALTQYGGSSRVISRDPKEILTRTGGANVIDIVFENTKGSDKGHRACGIQGKDGKWYVYDPYYEIGRRDRRTAVPYDMYMAEMLGVQGKILVGVGLHTSNHPSLKNDD